MATWFAPFLVAATLVMGCGTKHRAVAPAVKGTASPSLNTPLVASSAVDRASATVALHETGTPTRVATASSSAARPSGSPEGQATGTPAARTTAASGVGTRERPVPLATAGFIDADWALTVQEVNSDGWRQVIDYSKQVLQQTATPIPGTRALLVLVSAAYRGAASARYDANHRLVLLDSNNVAFPLDSSNCAAVPEPGLLSDQEASSGSTAEGYACWILPSATISTLVMYDRDAPENTRVFFQLTP